MTLPCGTESGLAVSKWREAFMSGHPTFRLTDREIELAAVTCTRALQFIRMAIQGDVSSELTPKQLRKLAHDTAKLYVRFHNEAVARGMAQSGTEMTDEWVRLKPDATY
jgi:hypothetical protein